PLPLAVTTRPPPRSPLFPYTPLFRSTGVLLTALSFTRRVSAMLHVEHDDADDGTRTYRVQGQVFFACAVQFANSFDYLHAPGRVDRKSTRLNSSHVKISYAVFCLKKK